MVPSVQCYRLYNSGPPGVSDASSRSSASPVSSIHFDQSSTYRRRPLKLLGICARCRQVIWLPSQCDGLDETTTHECDPQASPYVGKLLSTCEEELAIHNQNLAYLILEANHYIMTTYAMRPHVLKTLPHLPTIDRPYWYGDVPDQLLPFVECPPKDDTAPVHSPFISICPCCCQVVWYSTRGDANHHWGTYRNESFDEKLRRIGGYTRGFLSLRTVTLLEKENLALRNMDWREASKDSSDGGDTIQWGADESAAPLCKYREGSHWSQRNCEGKEGETMRKHQMAELHEFLLARFGTSPHTKINMPARAQPGRGQGRDGGKDEEDDDDDDYDDDGADGLPTVPVKPLYTLTPYQMRDGWPFSWDFFGSQLRGIQRSLMSFFRITMPPRQPPLPGNAFRMPYLVFPDLIAYESRPSTPPLRCPPPSRPKISAVAASAVATPAVEEKKEEESKVKEIVFADVDMDGELHKSLPSLASWAPPLNQPPFWGGNANSMQQPFSMLQPPVQLPQIGQHPSSLYGMPLPPMYPGLYPIPPTPQSHLPAYSTQYPLGMSLDEKCVCGNIRGSLECTIYHM